MENKIATQCVLVCKVPQGINLDNLVSVVERKLSERFITGNQIVATKIVAEFASDGDQAQIVWRCILLLGSRECAKYLYSEHQQDVQFGNDTYTIEYQSVSICAVPAEWIPENTKMDNQQLAPLHITSSPSVPTPFDAMPVNQFEHVSGFHENYHVPVQPVPAQMLRQFPPEHVQYPGIMSYPNLMGVRMSGYYPNRLPYRMLQVMPVSQHVPPRNVQYIPRVPTPALVGNIRIPPPGMPPYPSATQFGPHTGQYFLFPMHPGPTLPPPLCRPPSSDGEIPTGNRQLLVSLPLYKAVEELDKKCDITEAESSAGELAQENANADSNAVKDSTKIIISNLPSAVNNEYLEIFFENRRFGGLSVASIQMLYDDGMAVVEFQESDAVSKIMDQVPIQMLGTTVNVELYTPEPHELESFCTIEVRGPANVINQECILLLQLYFENRKRSGGDSVADIDFDEELHVVYVTFRTEEVARRVVDRGTHVLNKEELLIQLHIPDRKQSARNMSVTNTEVIAGNEELQQSTCSVKVMGFPKSKSHMVLQNYFVNNPHSGGGGNVSITNDENDENALFVKFEEEKFAKAVASRKHKVEDCDLEVLLHIPTKPCYQNRVLIKGLKSTITQEGLFNFIEAKTGCVPKSLTYHADEEGVAMVTFEILDFQKVEESLQKHKFEGSSLQGSPVSISNCILVSNLKPEFTKDAVQYYFENKSKSGGGAVEKIVWLEDDGECLVYFYDFQVISDVLSLEHVVMEQKLDVRLYHECVAQPEGAVGECSLKVPNPVVIAGMDPRKIKFMKNSSTQCSAAANWLSNTFAKVSWPNDDNNNISIICTLTKEVKDCHKIAKNWRKNAEDCFNAFMKNIVEYKNDVIPEIWDKVMENLQKITIPNPEVVALFVDKKEGIVFIVGTRAVADDLSKTITETIKQITDMAEREKQKIRDVITNLKPIETQMLLANKFPDKTSKEYTNLKININKNKNEIVFDGIGEEVKEAKLKMYEMKVQFACHSIDSLSKLSLTLYALKPVKDHIVKKLKKKCVTAVWEVNNQTLQIYSVNQESLSTSVNTIRGSVIEHMVPLNSFQISLMNSDQWKSNVKEWHNLHAGKCHLYFKESSNQAYVCATDDIANELLDSVKSFLHLNTIYDDEITFKRSIHRLIEHHHKLIINDIVNKLQNYRVHISYGLNYNAFEIHGTREGVDFAIEKLKELAAQVKMREFTINKTGLGEYIKSVKGKDGINIVESTLECVIDIKDQESQEAARDSLDETIVAKPSQNATVDSLDETVFADQRSGFKIHAKCKFFDIRNVFVADGDMTELPVDVIINTTDKNLSLLGVLGQALVSKGIKVCLPLTDCSVDYELIKLILCLNGGKSILSDCQDYINQNGSLSAGDTFVSNGGNLNAQYIVHVIEPDQQQSSLECEDELLTEAVFKSMMQASLKQAKSVAMPAINWGVFSIPKKQATSIIVEAMKNFFREVQDSSVTEVYLCDIKTGVVRDFTHALEYEFGETSVEILDIIEEQEEKHVDPKVALPERTVQNGIRFGNINVTLVEGELAKQEVDVLENTTAKNLDLKSGVVSASLLAAAGRKLQEEINAKYPKGITDGEVAVTSGHGLQCHMVVHGTLPIWNKGDSIAVKALCKLMHSCLEEAQKQNYTSMAFPAMGTGLLGYPKDIVAKEMYSAISSFSRENPTSSITEVRFVVYQNNSPIIQAFQAEESHRLSGERGHADRSNKSAGEDTQSSTSGGYYKYGNLHLILTMGDITMEDVDCIVNSSDENLDLTRGAVSQAIRMKGGYALQKEVDHKKNKMKTKQLVTTGAPNLKCKHIIHVVSQEDCNSWRDVVTCCLQKAEEKKVSSVAFPALGTAGQSLKAENIAQMMLEAISNFGMTKPKHLKVIKFVIFQPEMIKPFESVLAKTCGGKETGYACRASKLQNEYVPDKVTFVIWSLEVETIQKAIRKLKDHINKENQYKKLENSIIQRLPEHYVRQIQTIAENDPVKLKMNMDKGCIEIDGLFDNVAQVSDQIHSILRDATAEESNIHAADLLSNLVQWYITEISVTGHTLKPYDKLTNFQIEQAFKNKEPAIQFVVDGEKYILNFLTMTECLSRDTTDTANVIRRDIMKETSFEPPKLWIDMTGNLRVVTLTPKDQEYKDVEACFNASSGHSHTILKIERVQNKALWQQYQAKKKQLDSQNPCGIQNERLLWQGTTADTADSINAHGFNRSYCGKCATAYGDGVCFAVNAAYSCSNTYSPPDSNNIKHIYYCRVLTGEYTVGNSAMRVPPQKTAGGRHALYDSVVNNIHNPIMFVIFHDTQAYPEYLISFKA